MDSKLFYQMFQLGLKIEHIGKNLEKKSGITLTQWSILTLLVDQPGISANELALALGVQPSTMTNALKRLRLKNLIFVCSDPKDSRKKSVSITRAGSETLKKANSILLAWTGGKMDLSIEVISAVEKMI